MDTKRIARQFAEQIVEHRNRLAGKVEDAQRAHAALAAAHALLVEHRDGHRTAAGTATEHWSGKSADGFDTRAHRVTRSLGATSSAASDGAAVVARTAAALDGGHTAVVRLLDEYTTRASAALDAGLAVTGTGQRAAIIKAVGEVADLVRSYTGESAKQFRSVKEQMADSAKQLKSLERAVEHDGYVDPKAKRAGTAAASTKQAERKKDSGKPDRAKPKDDDDKKSGGTSKASSERVHDVLKYARSQLGYHEGAGNQNKYGPAAAWCSSFATWVWRKAGVKIPLLPFTGDVYKWGQEHGLSYGKGDLREARPGDVLLFGTGPQSPATSTHIAIVEKVEGNTVTTIEGNSGDQVARRTHTLSTATFYGGVHPR
ncbi:C40 family peptidase [Actinokineospora bangkokensis]|uniref:CHAP domain-containing protein n=1 Tax=Actinokineospora bangkokensis TaxID=1193682 RepID=A0A1Q9LT25_9PSEU|nr:CHAP domain-containing protein [Actinokineospora bangkokensis]OLR95151.1 CHAP domain-containing protein [Actinokineospora bangkokensis]